ncbi:hypothetical protein BDR03DRAFT_949298 [Suillus americanus]|nr:hypothetical protein BDR03DRAFT_949298 [Suillus americanus]
MTLISNDPSRTMTVVSRSNAGCGFMCIWELTPGHLSLYAPILGRRYLLNRRYRT